MRGGAVILGFLLLFGAASPAATLDGPASAAAGRGDDLYHRGLYREAIDVWQQAADKGDRAAGYRLAKAYIDGVSVERDFAVAARYLKPAAQSGLALAQFEYATLLDNGWGVEKSKTAAAKWYLEAARRGVTAAMFNIAAMLEAGEGIRGDVIEAFKWYYLAYEGGLAGIADLPMELLAERMTPVELHRALDLVQLFRPQEGG
jgi:TPR repeat protein